MGEGQMLWTRREVLSSAIGSVVGMAALAGGCSQPVGEPIAPPPPRRPRVAVIFTQLFFRSHAFNILDNFFEPYLFNGELVDPGCEVVSLYADQLGDSGMADAASQRVKIPLAKSVAEAVCVGGKQLAVDGVVIIGEHGDYPYNELGQHLYPRKEFFDQVLAEMRRADRFVPVFSDKHLSYRWDWAKEMYDAARRHKFPLMAGSSVPLGQRIPPLELPPGSEIEAAVAVHGGGMEVYGFHGLELLQSMVESRRGGETGIRSVEVVPEAMMDEAAKAGRWSPELVEAAMAAEASMGVRRQPIPPRPKNKATGDLPLNAPQNTNHVILVEYLDGLQGAIVRPKGDSNRWNFACRIKGESQPRSTAIFNGPWGNFCLFKALSHAIQSMIITGREPYPVERTLLTGGAIEAAMQSFAQGKAIETPHLAIKYDPVDFRQFREMGKSWERLTADTPQTIEFDPGDAKAISAKP